MLFVAIVLATTVVPATSISCYVGNDDVYDIMHGFDFCKTAYDGSEATLYGVYGTPPEDEFAVKNSNECNLTINKNYESILTCRCFGKKCKPPMSYDEALQAGLGFWFTDDKISDSNELSVMRTTEHH